MKKIIIRTLKEGKAKLYDPNGKVVGNIYTETQLDDVRLQIKRQQLTGYYILWVNTLVENTVTLIRIDRNGNLENWPKGFFDIHMEMMMSLVGFE